MDRDLGRANALGQAFGVASVCVDAGELDAKDVDAALVATPPGRHADVGALLLERGVSVLCEKPLARSAADGATMVAAAARSGAVLAAAHSRRFHANLVSLKVLADLGALGTLRRVIVRDGHPFAWPTRTGYMFRGDTACGVLLENGIHVLDTLLWLLGEDADVLRYSDDARGGVESHAAATLRFGETLADVMVSRLVELPNTLRLEGDLGWAEMPLYDGSPLRLHLPEGKVGSVLGPLDVSSDAPQDNPFVMARQLEDFAMAVAGRGTPRATGEDGLRAVALAERCYAQRPVPTVSARPASAEGTVAGLRVLITGATGFIGGALVDRLVEGGADVRALVREPGRAAALSRTTAEMAIGDVTRPETLGPACAGREVVVHCAAALGGHPTTMNHVNVEGTRLVMEAAAVAGVRRVVHVSTLAVHGSRFPGGLEPDGPLAPDTDYGRSKLAAERAARDIAARAGVELVIVRPTIVYGPGSSWWTMDPIERLRGGTLVMAGAGDGAANVVYVDDLVWALIRATLADDVDGHAYLVSGEERVRWSDFYGAYARMVGVPLRSWPMPFAVAVTAFTDALDRSIGTVSAASNGVRGWRLPAVIGLKGARFIAKPLYRVYRGELAHYRNRSWVSVDRTMQDLDWRPAHDLAAGMNAVERWMRDYGLLPEAGTDVAEA